MRTTKVLIGILTITAALAVQVQAQSFLTNGLVAYYPFNGNANDASGNGNNLVSTNVQFLNLNCWTSNPVAAFNHTNSQMRGQHSLFNGQSNWTWCAWIDPDTNTFTDPLQWLFAEYAIVTTNYQPIFVIGASHLGVYVASWNRGLLPSLWIGKYFYFTLTEGPHYVSLSLANGGVNTGALTFFVDGIRVDSAAHQSVAGSLSQTLSVSLGENPPNPLSTFGGKMDNVRIYNRALSSNEVALLYALESTPPCPPCTPHAALATPVVVSGFVVGGTISDGGCGYTNTPRVRIIGGGGSGAQAVAVVSNGVVTAVNVQVAGAGYTNNPIIVISPPFIPHPTMSGNVYLSGPFVTTVLELDLGNLSPYDNYQFEFTPVAGGAWSNFGTPFSPTATTATEYVPASGNTGFFRVKYVP